jgi:hypothetical protein
MHRLVAVPLFAAAVAVASAPMVAHAQKHAAAGKTVTVSGILVDTKCYPMDPRNKAVSHRTPGGEMKDCAKLCGRLGIPVAILTDKGEVWTLVTPTQDLADHMGEPARVTGARVYGGNQVRPDRIEVRDATGKWVEVKITTPM